MNVIEESDTLLVISVRQKSFIFTAWVFFVFGSGMAITGIVSEQTSLGWTLGFFAAGALSALLMIGIEKHVRITFDAEAGDLVAVTRQFRRDTTFRAPLANVTDVTIESRQQGPKTLYFLQFIGADRKPLSFIHYIDPSPEVEAPVSLMKEWLADYRTRREAAR